MIVVGASADRDHFDGAFLGLAVAAAAGLVLALFVTDRPSSDREIQVLARTR